MNHPFAGFDSPNYTQAPNVFYDQLVKEIDTLAELKVTEIAIRMTFGFHRNTAPMSISFLEKATGLEKRAVRDGVAAAILRGTLEVIKGPTPTESTVYGIRFSQPRNLKTEFANAQQKNNSAKPPEPAGAPLGGVASKAPPPPTSPPPTTPKKIKKSINKKGKVSQIQLPELGDLPESPTHRAMFTAIAEVTRQDPKLAGKQIGKLAKELLDAEYTPEQVRAAFGPRGIWYRIEFVGAASGTPPRLNQIAERLPVLLSRATEPPMRLKPRPGAAPHNGVVDLRPIPFTAKM